MQELQDVYTIDKRYVAPRQGNIKIQPLTWLKAYPKYPVIFASLSLLALVLSMTISFWYCNVSEKTILQPRAVFDFSTSLARQLN